jgi:VIT1/CCC1 family predicted Fe2+/Mn2+ transporter
MYNQGLIKGQPFWQFAMGVKYGWPASHTALTHAQAMMPANSVWSAFGIGKEQMPMVAQTMLRGGHVRVGMEDNIYIAKGIPEAQAADMAAEIMKDKSKAHEILVKEELGINAEELQGSAAEAAIYSFLMFAIGAIIPILPFFFVTGYKAVLVSIAASTVGLFFIGAAITLFTGKSVWFSGFRQVLFGLMAAAITFGIGKIIGISVG